MHTAAVRIHSALIGSWRCSATPPMAMAPTMASTAAEIFLIMLLPRVAAATPALAVALTHSGREQPPARDGVRPSPASLPRARRFHMASLLRIFSDTERGGANTRIRIYKCAAMKPYEIFWRAGV